MKKAVYLILCVVFLLASLYSFGVYAFGPGAETAGFGVVLLTLFGVMQLVCLALWAANLRLTHIGRWNADIFSTIVFFLTFLLSFAMPSALTGGLSASGAAAWFGPFSAVALRLATAGIALYEPLLFAATAAMGLTIGEGDKRTSHNGTKTAC